MRHGRACPGHSRFDAEDVDTRDKAGHDGCLRAKISGS
jgi:hypothetical protein